MLWILVTLVAAVGQTARNAMQSSLTASLGTLGATQVRFLFGFPFALVFLALVAAAARTSVPGPTATFIVYTSAGALAQIFGTALLLATMRATTTLVWSLAIQAFLLGAWLLAFDRSALARSFAVWPQSLLAGFMGAFASQFWFLGFSLTAAANVRTLALVEVLFAQAVSRRVFGQDVSAREAAGMALVIAGVALLLFAP